MSLSRTRPLALPPPDLRRALDHVEQHLIDRALSRSRGNRFAAAGDLGLDKPTLAAHQRRIG